MPHRLEVRNRTNVGINICETIIPPRQGRIFSAEALKAWIGTAFGNRNRVETMTEIRPVGADGVTSDRIISVEQLLAPAPKAKAPNPAPDASPPPPAPEPEPESKQQPYELLGSIDRKNRDLWTSSGKPTVEAAEAATGLDLKAADRDRLWEAYKEHSGAEDNPAG